MSDSETAEEPTMEEILASIRRIISEDEEEEAPEAEEEAPEAEEEPEKIEEAEPVAEDVLELTEVVEEAEPEPEPEPEPEVEPEPEPEPPAVVEDDLMLVDREDEIDEELEEEILSPETESHVVNVIGEFSRNMAVRDGLDAQTVEGLVREMLRPMLQSWLDNNLPSLVERIVEREIKRVSKVR